MIRVELLHRSGVLCGFTSTGHAGYGYEGTDIVCAAVSALTQACANGLTDVLNLTPYVSCAQMGALTCILKPDMTPAQMKDAGILLETLRLGLEAIVESYPGTLKIRNREV